MEPSGGLLLGSGAGDFFKGSSSTASSTATFLELAPSQLGICGRESSPPFLDISNSAYCGGAATAGGADVAKGAGACIDPWGWYPW